MEMNLLTENKKVKPKTSTEASIVPAGTKLVTYFRHNAVKKYTELVVQTNNNAIVKSVVVFAEQIFANESEVRYFAFLLIFFLISLKVPWQTQQIHLLFL